MSKISSRMLRVGSMAPVALCCAAAFGQGIPTPRPVPVAFEPVELNDICVGPFGSQSIEILEDCTLITGKLEERTVPGPAPDTWLCVVDKQDRIVAEDDNGAVDKGNSKASGIWSDDDNNDGWADILTDNGDGTRSLRLIVTGFPDGFDGNCNGFFQNAPHGQYGEWCMNIVYEDANGVAFGWDDYRDEFITGAEAFRVNFTAPAGAASVHIQIDNTCGRLPYCGDVDYMCLTGLIPLEPYCITTVGGLDHECLPTDTQLCWIDKDCNVIATDDDSGPAPGYSQLCVIADINGNICIAVSGGGDANCDGYDDDCVIPIASTENVAVPFLDCYHGVCGTYTLKVAYDGDKIYQDSEPCTTSEAAARGDINLDGIVDTVDLVVLLSNWGATTIVP